MPLELNRRSVVGVQLLSCGKCPVYIGVITEDRLGCRYSFKNLNCLAFNLRGGDDFIISNNNVISQKFPQVTPSDKVHLVVNQERKNVFVYLNFNLLVEMVLDPVFLQKPLYLFVSMSTSTDEVAFLNQ